jgi:hypothetical protein
MTACDNNASCIGINSNDASCELLQYAPEFAVVSSAWDPSANEGVSGIDGWRYFVKEQPRNDTKIYPVISGDFLPLTPPSGQVALLGNGPFTTAFQRNQQQYIKAWFGIDAVGTPNHTAGVDNLAYFFRQRAGDPQPPGTPVGWDCGLKGSAASGVMMGAGHSLRWHEDTALRSALTDLVDAISSAADPQTGYAVGFEPNVTACHENPDYVSSWFAHGMQAADSAGVAGALDTLRNHLSWFNNNTWLPVFLPTDGGPHPLAFPPHWDNKTTGGVGAGCGHLIYLEYQGLIKSTQMALSRLGTQADVDIIRELYEERWWLQELAACNDTAVWKRVPFAHNYEGTAINAYMDMYRLTGEELYLQASMAWWSMLRESWIDPATGVIQLNEIVYYPPKSYLLTFNGYDTTYPSNNPFPPTEAEQAIARAAGAPGAKPGSAVNGTGVLLPHYHHHHHHSQHGHHGHDPPAGAADSHSEQSANVAVMPSGVEGSAASAGLGPAAPVCKGPTAHHDATAQRPLAGYIGSPIGELCGHVFWVLFNQRLRRLFPGNETFAGEIERSLVNVALAQSVGTDSSTGRTRGIRHFTSLHRAKMPPRMVQDCCEGSGTRLYGNLPEFVFFLNEAASQAESVPVLLRGIGNTSGLGRVVVDQYFPASITAPAAPGSSDWEAHVEVTDSAFPLQENVSVTVSVSQTAPQSDMLGPVTAVSLRIPAWANGAALPGQIPDPGSNVTVPVLLNGAPVGVGKPGSYFTVRRRWSSDRAHPDVLAMVFGMHLQAYPYRGVTTIQGHQRVAVSKGPVALVATGPWSNATQSIRVQGVPDPTETPSKWLRPVGGSNGFTFTVAADPAIAFSPYFELDDNVLMDVYPAFAPV